LAFAFHFSIIKKTKNMVKYMQEIKDELTDLKKGMVGNTAIWAGQPVTAAQVQAAIDAITAKSDEMDAAEVLLQQKRAEGRNLVEQYSPMVKQVTTLATGLHTTSPEKLGEYGIDLPKTATTIPVPAKAVIASLTDDVDGEGFIITIQPLANADTFEVEKGMTAAADITTLATPFTYFKTSKKLSFVDDDVLRGKRYFYRVRGLNRNGYGEWSEPVSRVQ
jgi:fibronectin type 3 domain-containing protein